MTKPREQKTLIVGPKKGTIKFLAECAHTALVVLRFLPKLSLAAVLVQIVALALGKRLFRFNTWYKKLMGLYFASEAGFYLAMRARQDWVLQRRERERVPELTVDQRQALFQRCLDSIPASTFLEQWFNPVTPFPKLQRENVLELVSWAFFHKDYEWELVNASEREQLVSMVNRIERDLGHSFLEGKNSNVQLLKFTDHAVQGQHRSWLIYLVVHFGFQLVLLPGLLHWRGYRKLVSGDLIYWYKPGTNSTLDPVVFLHGIGVGILPYQSYLLELEQAMSGERGILVPEIQAISQRLLPSELHFKTFAYDLNYAIRQIHHHSRAHFVGHSYGTFCVSWMVKLYPELVASVGLIDPASVLLHSTDVLVNILYHQPLPNSVEYTLDYIMRAEVSLQHNLRRQFYWFQNILFLEEIATAQVPTFVCLSDTDQLVPIDEIKQYIMNYNAGELLGGDSKPNGQPKPYSNK
ncbi:hypothetical protein BASA81_005786 [Batrachochytrium salamandrivorans]|nr:hypothetical protein BASA81_005786 [Batrachochytrium salamandrivorans]